tara:strand:- start:2431 stop:3024 length:594 start_codon:yes stop_codon:yes gene_type:complete
MIEDYILIQEDSVNKNLCSAILNYFNFMVEKGYFRSSLTENPNPHDRRDMCAHFPQAHHAMHLDNVMPEHLVPLEWVQEYMDNIDQLAHHYSLEHNIQQPLHCPGFKGHQVTKGKGYYNFHYEADCKMVADRVLTFMTYLEKPDEGGETEFLFQSKRISPEVGTTVMWPAYFTHPHRGNPVLSGRKTYLTGWYFFNQ